MTFGQQIQALRKELGLSQDALASQLYVTRQSVSQWENDKTMPSVDLLLKLSQIFGVTVDTLLGKPEAESIDKPIAEAEILNGRGIRRAMSFEFSIAISILISAAIGYGLLAVLNFICYISVVPKIIISHEFYIWREFYYLFAFGAVCLASAIVLFVIRIIHIQKAAKFAKMHKSVLKFFYDHLDIEEEGSEPLSLFYGNIKRITETDCYIIFKMQNRACLCIDKRQLECGGQISMLLRSAKNHINRSVYKNSACPISEKRIALLKFFRELFFVLIFFVESSIVEQYRILLTGFLKSQFLRVIFWLIPFVFLAAAIIYGIVLTIRHVKAKRLIIAGSVMMVISVYLTVGINSFTIYDFQDERITAEQFKQSMEERGLEVENTIKGREENFITACYTASPENKTYEILFMEFNSDSSIGHYGLNSAYEAFGKLLAETLAEPRKYTHYVSLDMWYNKVFFEETDNHYTYISLNEYSIIYFEVSPEKQAGVQEILKDFELSFPY